MVSIDKMLSNLKCRKKTTFKYLFYYFIFNLFLVNSSHAQVGTYTFTQALVGYTPLTGTPTVAYPVGYDDHSTGAAYQVTMPFSFVFDNVSYTQFYISPNGFITFGAIQPAPTNYGPLNNSTAYIGAISALGMDLMSNGLAGSDIEFGVIGSAPNRTMVVQWTDAVRKLDAGNFNFQIRLNETTNSVELSYGLCQPAGTTIRTAQVGLRGPTNNAAQGNVSNRVQGSSTTWFGNTLTIINNNASTVRTVYSASVGASAYPDLGLLYTYSPAPPCVTPSAQPSGLIIGGTSITDVSFVGNSFTPASPAPTNYMVLRSTSSVPPTSAMVVDRTYYPLNSVLGIVYRVVSTSNATTFTQTGLLPDTTYYYWVIPYNDMCTGAPFYNMSGMISASATTCSGATTAAAATSVGGNDFIANWTVVTGATNYVLDVSTNNTFTALVPGYANLSVGLVTNYTVTGLLPLTTYYYRIRAIGSGCVINSNTITVATTCGYYTIPYVQNFDSFATGIIPPCYTRVDANSDGFQWQTQAINFSSASRSLHMAKSPTIDMNDWFFLPGLNLTGGVSYRLFFRYNTGNTTTFYENLKVRLGNGASIAAMSETLIDLPNINNSAFQVAIVDFIPVTSGVYYLGFQGYSVANQTYIVIDDVSVTISPNCFEPSDVAIPVVGTNSATVTWTASSPAPANGYNYYVSTSNTPPTGATIPTGSVGAGITTATITGLLSSTYYYVWVRGNCSAVDKSVWTLEESFSTECATPIVNSTTPATRCGNGTVTLVAVPNSGSSINWYSSSTGGSVLFNGNNFTTPAISATTTFYAEAKAFGAVAKVGPSSPLNEGGTFGVQNFSSAINFNVTSNTTLLSFDIYPMVSGQSGQLVLRNSSNTTMATYPYTTTVAGGATAQVININYALSPGNYNIYFSTVPASGIRMNTTNAFYPYTSIVANIQNNITDNTQFLGLYNWKFTTECLSSRVPVVATVTTPPSLTISSPSSSICENTSSGLVTVSGYAAYNSLVWTPNTGISGSFASGFTFNPTTTTTYTLTANQTSGGLCGNVLTHTVVVKPAPPAIMVVPSTATICENTIQSLNGSASASAAVPIFTGDFNSASTGWTVANTSVGGNTSASEWTLRPDGYNYINGFGWNVTFHSNDNSQFYLANSDAQSAVTGILTRTTLTSPSFSLAGYTSASLSYYQYIRYVANDITLVQVSIDGGVTWTTVKTYLASQGAVAAFANDTVNLNPYLGNTNVKLRFNFTSQWGYVWALDNVVVSGTLAAALTWTPITYLYTDPAATIPYTTGTPLTVVYSKPSSTITYTASLTGVNGCLRTNTTTLTVIPATVAGVASTDQTLCAGIAPSNIILSGYVGNIVRWEYADDAAFTINVTSIANTTNTLTPAQMGSFTTIRYFRAVVKSGICNQLNSNVVYVSYPTTTWNGSVWSNGVPNSSTRAIFNGNFSSTSNLSACSVRVDSGVVTFNSNHTLIVGYDVVVAGGSLVFENNASLVQINNATNSGSIVYKRNTTPMKLYDFTYWSTPVAPQTLLALSPNTPADKYFKFDTTVNNWVPVASFNLMDPGKGYIIRAPITFNPVSTSVFNGVFNGVPNNGTITTPIGVSPGNFNLIGNPYPSALSADLFLSDPANVSVVDATIYLWTHNTPVTANQYTSNDYAVYNYLGGVGTSSAPNSGVNTSVPNGKIASGQSFFVKGLTAGNATFKNSMRIVGNNDQFFKFSSDSHLNPTNQDFEKHRIWLDVVGNQGSYKQTLVGYAQNATNEMDRGFDGEFLDVGNPVAIYSMNNGSRLNVQGRALPFNVDDEVALGFRTTTAGSFQINLYDFDGLFANQDIYIKDNFLNIIHDLKSGSYSFVSESGTFENRFVLVYKNSLLGVSNSVFNADSVVLYKPHSKVIINSGATLMKEVKVYDVRGRLLMEKKEINASIIDFDLGTTNQVLLFHITSDDSRTIVKKYVN